MQRNCLLLSLSSPRTYCDSNRYFTTSNKETQVTILHMQNGTNCRPTNYSKFLLFLAKVLAEITRTAHTNSNCWSHILLEIRRLGQNQYWECLHFSLGHKKTKPAIYLQVTQFKCNTCRTKVKTKISRN